MIEYAINKLMKKISSEKKKRYLLMKYIYIYIIKR